LRSKKPVHMLVTLSPHPLPRPELDMLVTLRRLTRELRPGERDTRYMSIDFKEWRDSSVRRRQHEAPGSSRKRGVKLPTTHKLKATDTLYSLAHEYYGTYGPWRLIRDANGIPKRFGAKTKIVTLPGHFKVGHKLKIPQVPDPTRTTHKSGGAGL
jgi:nucleoid-associated protein YgaU